VAVALAFLAFAFMPKVIAGLALMPSPVIGAGLIYVACYLMTSGVHLIVSRMLDARRTFIIGLAIIGGVGVDVVPEAFAVAPTWLQPFVSSPLALSTTLAVALNLILSIGVSNTARLHLELDQPIRDAAIRFLEHYGAVWGARNDVIQRAAPALTDWCEELRQYTGYPGAEVEMRFDEFRLSMLVRCDQTEAPEQDSVTAAGGLETILRHIRRRYDCTAAPVSDDGFSAVRIDFVH
jgi:NCS2 family nucleobase:cation symporter-2